MEGNGLPGEWDEYWDEVGWDEHPDHDDRVGLLGYWNPVDATVGGWTLDRIGRRYRWRNWETFETDGFPAEDDLTAFRTMAAAVDRTAEIQIVWAPLRHIDPGTLLDELDGELTMTDTVELNGEPWQFVTGRWRRTTNPGDRP